jgi:Xaa-Pro aminopeptidase
VTATALETLPRGRLLVDLVERERLDGLVACSYEALSYFALTDIQTQLHLAERLEFLLCGRDGSPALLVCNIEESQVRTQSPIEDVRAYVEFADDPAEALAALLRERGLVRGRLGIEAARLPAAAARTLARELPELELVAADRALALAQRSKLDAEVDALAGIARSLLGALDSTIAALGADATELDYGRELVARVAATGAMPLFLVFSSGERTALGHPEPDGSPLRPGAIWRTDFGARRIGGLVGDVARTGVVGGASAEQEEIFAAVRAAQDAAVALAEPGRPARELFTAVERTFESASLPFAMPHVGHGIGIGLHEPPLLEPGNDTRLAVGAVLDIEPFAILADRGEGYHTEDLVLVGADGPQRLTTPQDALIVIG